MEKHAVRTLLFAFLAGLPGWVGCAGNKPTIPGLFAQDRTDVVPGIVPPAKQIETLRRLGEKAPRIGPAQQEEIEVCATAHDLREARSLLNKLQTVEILVLDWPAPASKNTGMDVLRQLLEKYPRIRCLLISLYDDPFSVKQALDAGVYGYVTKAMAAEKICTATHVLAAGQRYFSPDVLDALPQSFRMEIIA